MVNVADLFTLYKDAIKHNYELFEENVREFLGTQGINNGIIKTLQSPTDRENFFYYNNGIILIFIGVIGLLIAFGSFVIALLAFLDRDKDHKRKK